MKNKKHNIKNPLYRNFCETYKKVQVQYYTGSGNLIVL